MKVILTTVLSVLIFAAVAWGQDKETPENMGFPMKPNKEHALLKKDVGVWDADITMFMDPNAEPTKSKGVETDKMLGDFWLMTHFEYDFMGQQVTGHGLIGYDPSKKKYVGTWHESASPYMATMEGTYDEKTNKMTYMMKAKNPAGVEESYKIVMTHVDDGNRLFEMFAPTPGSDKMTRMMEIKYKKR